MYFRRVKAASSMYVSLSLCAILTDSNFFRSVSDFDAKNVLFQAPLN